MATGNNNAESTLNADVVKVFTRKYQALLTESMVAMAGGKPAEEVTFSQIIDLMTDSMREYGLSEEEISSVSALKTDQDVINQLSQFCEMTQNGKVDEMLLSNLELPEGGLKSQSTWGSRIRDSYNDFLHAMSQPANKSIDGITTSLTELYAENKYFANAAIAAKGLLPDHFKEVMKVHNYNKVMAVLQNDLAQAAQDDALNKLFNKNVDKTALVSREIRLESELNDVNDAATGTDRIRPVNNEIKWRNRVESSNKFGTTVKLSAAASSLNIVVGGKGFIGGFSDLSALEEKHMTGEISDAEYTRQKHMTNLTISRSFFSTSKGIADIGALISYKLAENAGKESAEKVGRFAPVAGNIIGVMSSVNSVVQKSIQAHYALASGNGGRGAMYAVAATLDSINVVLNGVGAALDVIPGIGTLASFVIDVVSSAVDFISSLIAGLAELVDTRTDEEKLQQAFDEFIDSKAFKDQVQQFSNSFAEQGYDVFKYIVDTKGADLDTESSATHDQIASHTELVKLTEQAREQAKELRIAIIDNTFKSDTLEGGPLNDYIRMVGGGDKTLNGKENNDTLIGNVDKQLLLGGEGDDFLDGRQDADSYESGPGDDVVAIQPSVDIYANDTLGNDTLLAHEGEGLDLSRRLVTRDGARKGIADKILNGQKTLYNGEPISNYMIETDTMTIDLSRKEAFVGVPTEFRINDLDNYDFAQDGFFNEGVKDWSQQLEDLMLYHDLKPTLYDALDNAGTNFDREWMRQSTYEGVADYINRLAEYSGDQNLSQLGRATNGMTAEWQQQLIYLFKNRSVVSVDEVRNAMRSFLSEISNFDENNHGYSSGQDFFNRYNKQYVKNVSPRFEELGALLTCFADATVGYNYRLESVSNSSMSDKDLWHLGSDSGKAYLTDGKFLYIREEKVWGPEFKRSSLDISHISESSVILDKYTPMKVRDTGMVSDHISSMAQGVYDPSQRLLAELYLRFTKTAVTGYENVAVKDVDKQTYANVYGYRGDNKSNTDISAQLIGDQNSNYLSINESVSHTKHNFLSGKAGDDVLSVARYADVQQAKGGKLTLDGGDGTDTAVLKYSLRDKNHQPDSFTLKVSNEHTDNDTIKANDIENFVVRTDFNAAKGEIDFSGYSAPETGEKENNKGIQITLDSNINEMTVTTTAKNDVVNINKLGMYTHISNVGGSDTINLTHLEYSNGVKANLGLGYLEGRGDNSPKVTFDNINNIIGSQGSDELLGNRNANFMHAEGGSDIVLAGEGNDVLSASTGQHKLIGGEGQDHYLLDAGKEKKEVSIKLSRDNRGQYQHSTIPGNGKLAVEADEQLLMSSNIFSDHVRVMMGERDVTKYFVGKIENGKPVILFDQSNFEALHLKNGDDVELKLSYFVKSNGLAEASVKESDFGNELTLKNFADIRELTPELSEEGGLQFKDKHGAVIFRDLAWLDSFKAGQTDLEALSLNFAQRFNKIAFGKSASELQGAEISDWLMDAFTKRELKQAEAKWNLNIDVARDGTVEGGIGNDQYLVNAVGGIVNGGDGNNYYKVSGTSAGNDMTIISGDNGRNYVDLTSLEHKVSLYNHDGGKGDTLNLRGCSIADLTVNDRFANLPPESIKAFTATLTPRYQLFVNQKEVAMLATDQTVEYLTVQDGDKTWIVSDVPGYLTAKAANEPYHVSEYISSNGNLGLSFEPYRSDQISMTVLNENNTATLQISADGQSLYKGTIGKNSGSYLSISELAEGMSSAFEAGIGFSDGTYRSEQLVSKLESLLSDPARTISADYKLLNADNYDMVDVVNASFEETLSDRKTPVGLAYAKGWNFKRDTYYNSGVIGLDIGFDEIKNAIIPDGKRMMALRYGPVAVEQVTNEQLDKSADYLLSMDLAFAGYGREAVDLSLSVEVYAGDHLIANAKPVIGDLTKGDGAYANPQWYQFEMEIDGNAGDVLASGPLKLRIDNRQENNDPAYNSEKVYVDNVKLMKLTGAMATFGSEEGISNTANTNAEYSLKPILTSVV
ncbi:hypothetical protein C942_04573 [Photobacterium marinum]|uniref:RTX toxin n=1 Tax=Photobacterium marinum TaxID=1056511 RepID=L8JH80_9GAMM|nr:calcium-binding protein [Photobacterium marinum]ELR66874.1 hypothetical protein C942_04573 [Photobacterium marinum]